jgi:hypothetical protein
MEIEESILLQEKENKTLLFVLQQKITKQKEKLAELINQG